MTRCLKAGLLTMALALGVSLPSCGSENGNVISIARIWNEANLDAIRIDIPNPPVHARNLWHVSVAMYDAWAVYDPVADGYLTTEKIAGLSDAEIRAARREAISYAAYRVLRNRYALSVNATESLTEFHDLMVTLGYDPDVVTEVGDSPAAVGNRVAAAVIVFGDSDGSNQAGNYEDSTYMPVNDGLVVKFPGTEMNDPNRWQPLILDVFFTQNGILITLNEQEFLAPHWDEVTPFALVRGMDPDAPYLDPGTPPRLGGATDAEFKSAAMELIRKSAGLDPTNGVYVDTSPASYGNNNLGTNDGTGYDVNPVTGRPYTPRIVPQADFGRVIAEYWADGPDSETPPGHWNTLANYVSDHPLETHQFEGIGDPLDRLEWDVKLLFALNAATHDAAVQCWGTKRYYDYVRPISMIRYMGGKGQSSDAGLPSYDPEGLPLEPDLIELVTDETWPDGRHAALECCVDAMGNPAPCVDPEGGMGTPVSCVGEIAIRSWSGYVDDPLTEFGGSGWIRSLEWVPYQRASFVSPAFAAYTSGHSTFSRAAAEVLAAFTGSPYFPGGMGEFVAHKNKFLLFELGPSEDVHLQWATYYDAADQAGQSRLWGGIHVRADDFGGRVAGAEIGSLVFAKARTYFDGTAVP